MNSATDYSKKHLIRHFPYYGVGLLVVGYAVFVFYWMTHLPYVGFYTDLGAGESYPKVIAVEPGSPGDRLGLSIGDEILKIGAYKILNFIDIGLLLNTIKPNQAYEISYKRGTSILTGNLVTDSPYFSYYTLVGIILSALYFGLGFTVYLKKSSDPTAKIFYLLMVCIFATFVVIFNFRVVLNPACFITFILCIFIAPLFLHFSLIFPERKRIIIKHPLMLALIYFPALALLSVEGFLIFKVGQFYLKGQNYPSFFHYSILMMQYYLVLLIIYLGIGIACMAHTYATTFSPEGRKQIKWVFWGNAVFTIFIFWGLYAFFQNLQQFLYEGRILPIPMILALIIPFFTVSLSIFRYRLMDIDIVIHRSLTYFLVSVFIVLFYFLLFAFFSRIFKFIAGSSPFLTIVISTLVVAIIFRPLLVRIEQWIDRLFFKEKYALHKAIGDVSQVLITVRDSKAIFERIFQIVGVTLNVRSGRFWLQDEAGKTLKESYSFPQAENPSFLPIDLSHPLALLLIKTCKGLTHYQVRTEPRFRDHQDTYLEFYEKTGTEIFLPLIFQDTLIGLIGFGEKGSGDLYSSEDVGLLTTLARQTAVAMENARAYTQTKRLNVELRKKIGQIEQQQGEILALQKHLLNENTYLREEIQQNFNFDEIIGESPPMKEVLSMVEKIAPTLSTVLIRGESGTGKELIARAIHFNSPRRDAPFVKVNCAAIPANLLESELFGHEKGAFTGAIKLKVGKFEQAAGGSIFLDEIGDLEPDLQIKLLRVLQEKEFERVGGNSTIKADIRIITATHRDIEKAISDGVFREDLFYRLNVISIFLPPLRDRKEDIRELSIHFLQKFGRQMSKSIQNIDPESMEALKLYNWPGNVRELANIIERSVVLGEGEILLINDLPQSLISSSEPVNSPNMIGNLPYEIEQLERKRIIEAMEKTNGNKSEAARMLNLKRSTFGSKFKKYNI